MLGNVARCLVSLFDRDGVLCFRRTAHFDEYHGHPRAHADLADQSVMCMHITENPAAAVEVHECREQIASRPRANDARAHEAAGTKGKSQILDVGAGSANGAGLKFRQHRSRLLRG